MPDRTFKVTHPPMKGKDVKAWQQDVKRAFKARFNIDCPIQVDGIYGVHSQSYTAALVHSFGLSAGKQMAHGVTPELRVILRNPDDKLTPAQKKVRDSKTRKAYRDDLKKRWTITKVHPIVAKMITDSWGWHPGVHDGLDVIVSGPVPTYAMVKCKVIDVRASGWWGLNPQASGGHSVSEGDGIVQMEVLESVGPFKKGMHIGYGHNEGAVVKVGQILNPGDHVAHAGYANMWHIHLMFNDGKEGTRGVGTMDPKPFVDYTLKHG